MEGNDARRAPSLPGRLAWAGGEDWEGRGVGRALVRAGQGAQRDQGRSVGSAVRAGAVGSASLCEGQSGPEAGRWGLQAAGLRPVSGWLWAVSGPRPWPVDPCLELGASLGSRMVLSDQVIVRSCSGINFEEFYHFLKVIAERRLLVLKKGTDCDAPEGGVGTRLGPQQAAFDASRIAEVLAAVVAHPDFQRVDTSMFSPQPAELLQQLEEVVASSASL